MRNRTYFRVVPAYHASMESTKGPPMLVDLQRLPSEAVAPPINATHYPQSCPCVAPTQRRGKVRVFQGCLIASLVRFPTPGCFEIFFISTHHIVLLQRHTFRNQHTFSHHDLARGRRLSLQSLSLLRCHRQCWAGVASTIGFDDLILGKGPSHCQVQPFILQW